MLPCIQCYPVAHLLPLKRGASTRSTNTGLALQALLCKLVTAVPAGYIIHDAHIPIWISRFGNKHDPHSLQNSVKVLLPMLGCMLHKVDKCHLNLHRRIRWHLFQRHATSDDHAMTIGAMQLCCGHVSGCHLALILQPQVAGVPFGPKRQLWRDPEHTLPTHLHWLDTISSDNAQIKARDDLIGQNNGIIDTFPVQLTDACRLLAETGGAHVHRR